MSKTNDWLYRIYNEFVSNVISDDNNDDQRPQWNDMFCQAFSCSPSPAASTNKNFNTHPSQKKPSLEVNKSLLSSPPPKLLENRRFVLPIPPKELLQTVHHPWNLDTNLSKPSKALSEFEEEFLTYLSQSLPVEVLFHENNRQELKTKQKMLWVSHDPKTPTRIGFLSKESKERKVLSRKYSMVLTDIILLTPSPKLNKEVSFEKRLIQIKSVSGISLLFVTSTIPEAEVILCGLKVLLANEAVRWGRRGGARIDFSLPSKYFLDDDDCYSSTTMTTSTSHHSSSNASNKYGGHLLLEDIVNNCIIPLPLPLCRVLLLDSNSPVISSWKLVSDRYCPWTFPTDYDKGVNSEKITDTQLLNSNKNLVGATRNLKDKDGGIFETHFIDSDDEEKVTCTISEYLPRNGFSIQIRIIFRRNDDHCKADIMAELRPTPSYIPKNYPPPSLILQDLNSRFGTDEKGLLGHFIRVVRNFPGGDFAENNSQIQRTKNLSHDLGMQTNSKKHGSENHIKPFGEVFDVVKSFDDRPGLENKFIYDAHKNDDPNNSNDKQIVNIKTRNNALTSDSAHPKFLRANRDGSPTLSIERRAAKNERNIERPGTPSFRTKMDHEETRPLSSQTKQQRKIIDDNLLRVHDNIKEKSSTKRTIEVKPLPKIRLDLMPAPLEADEENCSSASLSAYETTKTKKKFPSPMKKIDRKTITEAKRKRRSKR